jgi:sulfide:quinone oxidoreductase
MSHYQVLVIGGGNAGISISAYLKNQRPELQIAIVDPSEKHYYQPAWTLVGAGTFDIQKTERNQKNYIPKGVTWIKQRCVSFQPDDNQVTIEDGGTISYDYMVVCPGIQLDWGAVKGLEENLGKNGVCSNYSFQTAPYTFECIKNLKGGNAIFHNPHTPVKCGGAPHKIMYMAADYFRKHGILNKVNIEYWSGAARLFAVDKYEQTLLKVVKKGNIKLNFNYKLLEIDGVNKKAIFEGFADSNKDQKVEVAYDMIHVTPPQSAPDFIKQSPLVNAAGWVDVNVNTLQHNKYANIFSLGDAAGLPISKTGAAIRKQMPVAANNLLSLLDKKALDQQYTGYTSCPLVTGYGKLVLAEFDYNNEPQETFPFDQSKERWSMYQLKKHVLPRMYWNGILKGKM